MTVVRRVCVGAAVLLALLIAAGATSAVTARPPAKIDWDTYAFGIRRSGFNSAEHQISTKNVRRLHQVWTAKLGAISDTQPLYAAGVRVRVRGRIVLKDLVIGASEKGRVVAVNANTGRKVWGRDVGYLDINCGDLPHYGVTGTPVIDRSTNSLYVGDGKGRIDRLDLSTGRVEHSWTITKIPAKEHNWSALTLVGHVLYAEVAGPCDTPTYHGQIISVDTRSGSVRRWFVTGGPGGASGGGIWSFAGLSVDPRAGALYTATGNSDGPANHQGDAERVVRLTLGLRVTAADYPGLPSGDSDFGATPLLYRAPGCPRQLAVGDKYGPFFVYDRDHINNGPVQRISLGGSSYGQMGLLGIGAYWPSQRTVYESNPLPNGRYRAGMLAFRVDRHCRLALRWQAPGPGKLTSGPTVADGIVFYGTGIASRLVALSARSGKTLWKNKARDIRGPIFAAPTVVNGMVFVDSWDHRIHAFRLR